MGMSSLRVRRACLSGANCKRGLIYFRYCGFIYRVRRNQVRLYQGWDQLIKEKSQFIPQITFLQTLKKKYKLKHHVWQFCELLCQSGFGKRCPAGSLCYQPSSRPTASADGRLVACLEERACTYRSAPMTWTLLAHDTAQRALVLCAVILRTD